MNNKHDQFLSLLLKNEGDLKAFLGACVRERSDRDDLFQEVALTLWQRFDEFDAARSFGAWARGIAAKKLLQRRDRNSRFPLTLPPAAIQAVVAAYDRTEPGVADRTEALQDCLQQLPDRSRQVLALRYQEQLKPAQIAQQTGRTLDAVYQALSRIRGLLEECIRSRVALQEGGA